MMMLRQTEDEVHEAGEPADAGTFQCLDCSLPLSLDHTEEMPTVPSCGGNRFQRASIFEQTSDQPTLTQIAIQAPREARGRLARRAQGLDRGARQVPRLLRGRRTPS